MPTQEQARQRLQALIAQYDKDKQLNLTESDVIEKYLTPMFKEVLGWPTDDFAYYRNEVSLSKGRVDRVLLADNGERVYVEAKRFGVIDPLEKIESDQYVGEIRRAEANKKRRLSDVVRPQQLALPTMAVDRTAEEQQAINYAFQNGGQWAMLANFERLRLFNARRDWLVFTFESPAAYLEDFDLLWELSYERILKGSLDTLSNERFRVDIDSEYLALINEWRLLLANDLLSKRQENAWVFDGEQNVVLSTIRNVVQRIIDRLVIVRFAEDHLVINPGTLNGFYELRRDNPYAPSMVSLVQNLFRKFDEQHNSALFSEDVIDKALFTDEVLMSLVRDLYLVKFRSMPADILGNTYEQYLGKALVLDDDDTISTRDNLETRKKQGSYYTPQVIVRYIVDNSLGRYLYGTDNGKPDGAPLEGETRKTSQDIQDLRVLDSACGSGSFLIYAYEVLRDFYESEIQRLDAAYKAGITEIAEKMGTDTMALEIAVKAYDIEKARITHYPRIILEEHLYGVDLDPQAAEIAVVNLMMRGMEKQSTVKRLPLILNQNVKVGNALIGARPDDPRLPDHQDALARIRRLRADLKATPNTDPAHDTILDDLNAALTDIRQTLDADYAEHFDDLERVRTFHWAVEFPEAFVDETGVPLENAGFQVIIGNPPWEIVKPDLREFYAQFDEDIESRLSRKKAEARIDELNAEDPTLAPQWDDQKAHIEAQAAYYRASSDYTRQGRGDTATHKLFVERVYGLLRSQGRLGYVVPSGIYTDLGTKDLREMFLDEGAIDYIFSFSNERWFFEGVHHSFKFVLIGVQKDVKNDGFWATFRFNPRVAVAPENFPAFVADEENLVYVKSKSIEQFSPDSLSLMEFQSQLDYDAVTQIYSEFPLMGEEIENLWSIKFGREFDMTNDRDVFSTSTQPIVLYEGKMIHQYNAEYSEPRYWVKPSDAEIRYSRRRSSFPKHYLEPRFAFRAIARTTDERTLITTIIPGETICGHSMYTISGSELEYSKQLQLMSVMNSLVLDYIIRQKIATNVSLFHLYQSPMPRLTAGNPYFDALVQRAAQLTCTRSEFADLWREVVGSAWVDPATIAANDDDSALRPVVNPAARQILRDEIDALVAHLYGLSRAEFAHILGTFPLVFPDDADGQAKKEALLAQYDVWGARVAGWAR